MPKARDPNLPQHDINQGHFGELDPDFFPADVGDGKVQVTTDDDTRGFLEEKVEAGDNIEIEVVNPGATESLRISASGGGTTGEVMMADGVANPPEPLTNEDGDDWLYEG